MRRSRPSLCLASLTALLACTTAETSLLAPEGAQATTWVALARPTGGPWSIGLAASADALHLIVPKLQGELYLLGYPQGPAEIDGWLQSSCPPCALANPSEVFRRPLADGAWSPLPSAPEEVRAALVPDFGERCPASGLCPRFRSSDAVLPVGAGCGTMGGASCVPAVAVELDQGHALVAQLDGSLFRVGSDRGSEPLCELRGLRPLDGWRNAAGALWILAEDLRLARLQVSALPQSGPCPIEAIIDPPERARVQFLAVGESDAVELYALTSSRALVRYDGESWQVLHRFAEGDEAPVGGVVSIEPGHAAAVRGTGQVVEWQRGQLRLHSPIPGTEGFLHTLGRADNGRLAVAMDGFGVYQADQPAGPWSLLPGGRSFDSGRRLLGWGPYWLLSTGNGIQIYHQSQGLCADGFFLTGRVDPGKVAVLSLEAALVVETQTFDAQGLVMRVLEGPRVDCLGR